MKDERRSALWFRWIVIVGVLLTISQGTTYAMNVSLQWSPVGGSNLAGYRVYYDTKPGPPYSPCEADCGARYSIDGGETWHDLGSAQPISVSPNINGIKLGGLADAGGYFFAVTAFNSDGTESDYSREVSVFASQSVSLPYDKGWGITRGELEGFALFYNSLSDPGMTPTLDSSREIPSADIAGFQGIGSPLGLQPSGKIFNTPVRVLIPCQGQSVQDALGIGMYEEGKGWSLVWNNSEGIVGSETLDWLAGAPGYLGRGVSEGAMMIQIAVNHFSGVQLVAPVADLAVSGDNGGGSGGGCFVSAIRSGR